MLYAAGEFLPEDEVMALAARLWNWAQENPDSSLHALCGVEILVRKLKDPRFFERAVSARNDTPHAAVPLTAEAYLEADEPDEALEWLKRASRRLNPGFKGNGTNSSTGYANAWDGGRGIARRTAWSGFCAPWARKSSCCAAPRR